MKKLSVRKIKNIDKVKTPQIFDGLSDELKDTKSYYRIEKKLADIMKTDHKHKTVKEFATCAWCNKKRQIRQEYMKSQGFQSIEQYLQWRKVMEIIINKSNFQLK